MLIAMGLTGIVAYIALNMFAGQQANYTRTREKVKLQDDAREAMRIVEEDVRNAGFRTSVASEATGLSGSVNSCDAYVLDANSAAFTAGNRTTLAGDTLRIRYIEPDASTGQVVCGYGAASAFREIGYRQKGDTLQRMIRTDTTTAPTWVDLLYNVATFQVEYGLLRDPADTLATNTQLTTAANWSGSSGTTAATAASILTLSGWSTSSVFGYYRNAVTLDPRYTYRIAFDLTMNAAMRNGSNAIDSNTTSKLPKFTVGFFTAGGAASNALDTVYVYPQDGNLPNTARHIEVYVSPGTAGSRYLGFLTSYKSGAIANSGQNLQISNAVLSVSSRGQYFTWVDAPTAAQRMLVKAVKINLLAKSARSDKETIQPTFTNLDAAGLSYTASGVDSLKTHVLYQRIVPVVNNGT
jgi:type II secretory pathway component PulJ